MRKIEKQIEEYLRYCRDVRRMSRQTIRGRIWVCKQLADIGVDRVEDISNTLLNQWIAAQTERGCNARTVNMRIATAVAMLRYFQETGVRMPYLNLRLVVKQRELPPRRAYYTREQIDIVLSGADRLEWLLVRIGFDCGLRISELRNLQLSNVCGQRLNFVGKGGRAREAYMSPEAYDRLKDWVASEHVTDYLWSRHGRPLCVAEIRYILRRAFARAGLKDFYPHALRHSFATDIVTHGAPMEVVQKMLGHSNLATTERYVHSFEGRMGEFYEKYKFSVQ